MSEYQFLVPRPPAPPSPRNEPICELQNIEIHIAEELQRPDQGESTELTVMERSHLLEIVTMEVAVPATSSQAPALGGEVMTVGGEGVAEQDIQSSLDDHCYVTNNNMRMEVGQFPKLCGEGESSSGAVGNTCSAEGTAESQGGKLCLPD